jgi:hypothetical protein
MTMPPPPLSRRRRIAFAGVLALLGLLLLEGAVRVAVAMIQAGNPPDRARDPEWGWAARPHQRLTGSFPGYGEVTYSTGPHGFRRYDDPASLRPKVLVLGDSVTQARKVSDGEVYFDHLARRLGVEIFAYGSGGYGTLQEWLVLDRHLDALRPDLVLLQLCDNDFANNLHAMEARSRLNNNHMTRPYWEEGQVVLRYPSLSFAYDRVLRHSMLIRNLVIQGLALAGKKRGPSPHERLSADNPYFLQARTVTRDLLVKFQERASAQGIPVVAFLACGKTGRPAHLAFREICAEIGLPLVEDALTAVQAAAARGQILDGLPRDSHWNAAGNAVAGEALAPALAPWLGPRDPQKSAE